MVVILIREWTKAKMMSENGVENLRNLSWRSCANRIVRAICDQRRLARPCGLNHPRKI